MILQQIREWLTEQNISFREVHHQPTRTSEESALARGEDLCIGGKALLIKVDAIFRLFILSADRKLDSAAVKQHFDAKKTRFATPDELRELTGLVPGSVPPFGAPILPFPLYVDPSVLENERVAFNAGSLTDSIIMSVADYQRLARPEIFRFAIPNA
jgi:Ala-tRNA(Pro) deacylase